MVATSHSALPNIEQNRINYSSEERLTILRSLLAQMQTPPFDDGEEDLTMEEIVEECNIVRREMQDSEHYSHEAQ